MDASNELDDLNDVFTSKIIRLVGLIQEGDSDFLDDEEYGIINRISNSYPNLNIYGCSPYDIIKELNRPLTNFAHLLFKNCEEFFAHNSSNYNLDYYTSLSTGRLRRDIVMGDDSVRINVENYNFVFTTMVLYPDLAKLMFVDLLPDKTIDNIEREKIIFRNNIEEYRKKYMKGITSDEIVESINKSEILNIYKSDSEYAKFNYIKLCGKVNI